MPATVTHRSAKIGAQLCVSGIVDHGMWTWFKRGGSGGDGRRRGTHRLDAAGVGAYRPSLPPPAPARGEHAAYVGLAILDPPRRAVRRRQVG